MKMSYSKRLEQCQIEHHRAKNTRDKHLWNLVVEMYVHLITCPYRHSEKRADNRKMCRWGSKRLLDV